jgi:hypothetical protein
MPRSRPQDTGKAKPTPPPRLALLQARHAPVAVIFRRGPSKRVEVIRWDLTTDAFERGHWFHGRIYEKRSDLSPDGELLVYFASNFTRRSISDAEYTYAWTAVSRAPWLTALALWPKGDCWHGGGLFLGKRTLWLNHRPEAAVPHPAHPPRGLKVEPNPEAHGEDEPIYLRRLERDGWDLRQEWVTEWQGITHGYRTIAPDVRTKRRVRDDEPVAVVLERRIDNLSYRERFRVEGASNEVELPPGPLQWLDWDPNGRLVALSGGRVWAASVAGRHVARFFALLDLREDRPEQREAPDSARHW